MKRVICIWIPQWPLKRLCDARPELKRVPLALYESQARGVLRVVAVSQLARHCKVELGMTVAEATSVAMSAGRQRSGRLQWLECDPAADRRALVQLAAECELFSPLVGLEETPWPESLLLDVSGLGRLFGGEEALVRQVVEHFDRRQLPVRVALADTLGAAWAVAHYATAEQAESSPPGSGSWLIPPGETLTALADLPVESLRLPEKLIPWLRELGLLTLGQLRPLARGGIAARFGPEFLLRWDQALGDAPEIIRPCRVHNPVRAERLLEAPIANCEAIVRVLEQLLAKLSGTLAADSRGITRLACRLASESHAAVSFTIGLVRPTLEPRHLLDLLQLKLERLELEDPVVEIGLEVLASDRLAVEQQELFETGARGDERLVGQLVDRLASRLGSSAVVHARAWPSAQPEHAWRRVPIIAETRTVAEAVRLPKSRARVRGGSPTTSVTSRWPKLRAGQRPLRLEREPLPVRLVSVVPDGPPILLQLNGRQQRIVHRWGPERIETGWWRGRSARRDYYRVETESGQRLWLFRRLTDGEWFLHGYFD